MLGLYIYIYSCISSICIPPATCEPSWGSVRCLFISWRLFCLIMVATYTANLVAFLSVKKTVLPFHTIQEVAAQKQYKYGTTAGSFILDYFHVSVTLNAHYFNSWLLYCWTQYIYFDENTGSIIIRQK